MRVHSEKSIHLQSFQIQNTWSSKAQWTNWMIKHFWRPKGGTRRSGEKSILKTQKKITLQARNPNLMYELTWFTNTKEQKQKIISWSSALTWKSRLSARPSSLVLVPSRRVGRVVGLFGWFRALGDLERNFLGWALCMALVLKGIHSYFLYFWSLVFFGRILKFWIALRGNLTDEGQKADSFVLFFVYCTYTEFTEYIRVYMRSTNIHARRWRRWNQLVPLRGSSPCAPGRVQALCGGEASFGGGDLWKGAASGA